MDSDAVFNDLLEIEDDGRIFVDEEDSNLMLEMKSEITAEMKSLTFRWKNIKCGPATDQALDLRDCHHLNRVIRYLALFERHGHNVHKSNLSEFHLGEVIESIDHIVSVHELLAPEHRAEIQRYVAMHLVCDDGTECNLLNEDVYRRREREEGRIRTQHDHETEALDAIERECIVLSETLCSVHSLLLHRDHSLRCDARLGRFTNLVNSNDEQNKNDQVDALRNDDAPNAIDFGISVLRWIPFGERPHFESFRDEITQNPISTITEEIFERFLIECTKKIRNSTFTLKEMLALKFFTDCTKIQSLLRKAHWVGTPLSTKKMYYFWASALYEAALYHAAPIPSVDGKTPMVLYHGVNKMFTVDGEIPKYHGPFSSTTARSVAHHFTNEQGLFFKMLPSYTNKLKCCVGVNVEAISCHKHEREILLVDQFLPISTTKTFKNSDDALVNYLMSNIRRWSSEVTDRDRFLHQLGIRFDPKWIPLIGQNAQLFLRSKFRSRLVITRLAMELDIYSTEWIVFPLKNKNINARDVEELMTVEENIDRLLPLFRVMTSKFKVIQSIHLNLCLSIEFVQNTESNYVGDEAYVNETCFEETEYKINGIPAAHTVSTIAGTVQWIECRNSKYFGDHPIWIQEFPGPNGRELTNHEVVNFIEEHQVRRLVPHYRVLTSSFQVKQSNAFRETSAIKFVPNNKMDHLGDEKTFGNSCFEETEYAINGVTVPYTVSTVKGFVHQIQCRNTVLFGDRVVWVQEVAPSNQKLSKSDVHYHVSQYILICFVELFPICVSSFIAQKALERCAGGCGFWGDPAIESCGFCSKKNDSKEAAAKSDPPKHTESKKSPVQLTKPNPKEDLKPKKKVQKKKSRCWICRKKMTLGGQFAGKCGYTFCANHRYPDSHQCDSI